MARAPGGGGQAKWALRIEQKRSGTTRPATSSPATQGGTARTTAASPSASAPAPKSSATTSSPSTSRPRSRAPKRTFTSRVVSHVSAGSTNTASRLGTATMVRQARPPRAKDSRRNRPASHAEPSAGGQLSTASIIGSTTRSQKAPWLSTRSAIVAGPRQLSARRASAMCSPSVVPGVLRRGSSTHQGSGLSLTASVQRAPSLRS